MKLISGIKIYNSTNLLLRNRVKIANCSVKGVQIYGNKYQGNSFVPINSWNSLTRTQLKILMATNKNSLSSQTVSVVKLPNSLIQNISNFISNNDGKSTRSLERKLQSLDTKEIIDFVKQELTIDTENFTESGFAVYKNNLPTVTIDPQTKKYIGLHIDNWDNQPIEMREKSTNRICINFGSSVRYFIFINLSLSQVLNTLDFSKFSNEFIADVQLNPGLIHTLFFNSGYIDYPVIKLSVLPGEAYIAPTENIIHDGCTSGTFTKDINFTVRGNLNLSF